MGKKKMPFPPPKATKPGAGGGGKMPFPPPKGGKMRGY